MTNELEQLKKLALACTPQNLDTAEHKDDGNGQYVTCHLCNGDGSIELETTYTNYDNIAIGVQFFGVGNEFGAADRYLRAANPAAILQLIEHCESQAATIAELRTALSFYADQSRYEGSNQRLTEPDAWSEHVGLKAYRLDVTRDHGVIAAEALAGIRNTKPSAVDGAIEVPQEIPNNYPPAELITKWRLEHSQIPILHPSWHGYEARQAIAWDRQNRATKPAVSDATFESLLTAILKSQAELSQAQWYESAPAITKWTAQLAADKEALRQHIHALQSPLPDHVEDSLTMVPVSQQLTSEGPELQEAVCGPLRVAANLCEKHDYKTCAFTLRSVAEDIANGRLIPASALTREAACPINGIPETSRHGEGAYAQCGYCLRYSLEPRSLERETWPCDCGKTGGWSGSFKCPRPDSLYSGKQPKPPQMPTPITGSDK